MVKAALLMPASSPGCMSMTVMWNPCCSAQRVYMRTSIWVQSWASVPPAPAWKVRIALHVSYSPERSSSTSRFSMSFSRAWYCFSISSASPVSFSSIAISRKSSRSAHWVSSFSWPSTSVFRSVASWEIFFALSGSLQKSGSLICISRSMIFSFFLGRLK